MKTILFFTILVVTVLCLPVAGYLLNPLHLVAPVEAVANTCVSLMFFCLVLYLGFRRLSVQFAVLGHLVCLAVAECIGVALVFGALLISTHLNTFTMDPHAFAGDAALVVGALVGSVVILVVAYRQGSIELNTGHVITAAVGSTLTFATLFNLSR
jgi:hypothetical protein